MKWIKVDVPEHKEIDYVDVDKAFRFGIRPVKIKSEIRHIVAAYFLVNQSIKKTVAHYPVFINIKAFKTKELAEGFVKKLLGSFLEKEGE